MRTKVLIPAHNEEMRLGRTLKKLPRDLVEPIVMLNGCTDDTMGVAESYGAEVHDYDKKGKLPALQSTLRRLGTQALDPILLLDGDTMPLFPRAWHDIFMKSLTASEEPRYASGPLLFSPRRYGAIAESLYLSARRYTDGVRWSREDIECGNLVYYGPSQAMKFGNDATLERVLDLPHYWPKEDVAMAQAIAVDGTLEQLTDLRAIAISQVSNSMPPLHHWMTKSLEEIDREITANYRDDAPADSISYD